MEKFYHVKDCLTLIFGCVDMISLACASSSVTVKVRAIGFGNNVVALRPEETTVVGEVLLHQFFDRRACKEE